jgi:diguanylate cyclase (GGDEF)-like protein
MVGPVDGAHQEPVTGGSTDLVASRIPQLAASIDRTSKGRLRAVAIAGGAGAIALCALTRTRGARIHGEINDRLEHLAYHDPLTDLPNRALFLDRLADALAAPAHGARDVAVLFLDLDGFKLVNDSLGHAAGNALLVDVGHRLRQSLPPMATIARFGGDEFAVLLPGLVRPDDPATVATRLIESLRAPFTIDGRQTFVSISVGIATRTLRHAEPGALLREADTALYRAKAAGRSAYAAYEPGMRAMAVQRLERETGLRQAIERGELALRYQPVVDLPTGEIVGVEALLRWAHPEHGMLHPKEFIRLAEETGLIIPVGRWALREACRQARIWQAQYPASPPLVMSVNLSAHQLRRPSLAREIETVLSEVQLDTGLLELEITESIAMEEVRGAWGSLQNLRELGVRLAIDDFGTGYSSLDQLRRLAPDGLKIDRSFVAELGGDPGSQAIVRAVTTLAHDLGLIVTAEGVETTEQAARLHAIGVDRGQGFYFAPPTSGDAIGNLLSRATRLPGPPDAVTAAVAG